MLFGDTILLKVSPLARSLEINLAALNLEGFFKLFSLMNLLELWLDLTKERLFTKLFGEAKEFLRDPLLELFFQLPPFDFFKKELFLLLDLPKDRLFLNQSFV